MESSGKIGFLGSVKHLLGLTYGKENLWDNARFIFADVPVDAVRASRILPWALKLTDPARATLFIADYPKTSFTVPYHEAALLLHVRHPLGQGLHCPWMIVDDDTALIYGRELLGYPKKMGEFEFEEDKSSVRASLTRRGTRILSIEGAKGERQAHPAPAFDIKTFNVGGPGSFFGINPIWMFRPREVMHESLEMEVELRVESSEFDPIADIIAGDPVSGRFVVLDIVGGRYNIPVGVSGVQHLVNNLDMRFR